MKTMKDLLKCEVNKKFVVFSVLLFIVNVLAINKGFNYLYSYTLLFVIDFYLLKYVFIMYNNN